MVIISHIDFKMHFLQIGLINIFHFSGYYQDLPSCQIFRTSCGTTSLWLHFWPFIRNRPVVLRALHHYSDTVKIMYFSLLQIWQWEKQAWLPQFCPVILDSSIQCLQCLMWPSVIILAPLYHCCCIPLHHPAPAHWSQTTLMRIADIVMTFFCSKMLHCC